MSNLALSFHGGSTANSINNILSSTSSGLSPLLAANATQSLPALSELRGFFTDASGKLYVVNAYKNFSNILEFSPPAAGSQSYTFSKIFADGTKGGLEHPFCAILAPDGHVYVSNQDALAGKSSSAITYYEGPTKDHPGEYKGVFADGFATLRGIACDGTYVYAADEGGSSNPAGVYLYDMKGNKQSTSLTVNQPVHLLYDGSQYLYIGSEKDNAVYQYDTKKGGAPSKFITSSKTAPIDATSGLAINNGNFYVGSRKGMLVNQYPLSNPANGATFVQGLADNPEFLLFL